MGDLDPESVDGKPNDMSKIIDGSLKVNKNDPSFLAKSSNKKI
jgi:hypothetical protein